MKITIIAEGPPGCGKTSVLNILSEALLDSDFYVEKVHITTDHIMVLTVKTPDAPHIEEGV